jgi:hypothetical protein
MPIRKDPCQGAFSFHWGRRHADRCSIFTNRCGCEALAGPLQIHTSIPHPAVIIGFPILRVFQPYQPALTFPLIPSPRSYLSSRWGNTTMKRTILFPIMETKQCLSLWWGWVVVTQGARQTQKSCGRCALSNEMFGNPFPRRGLIKMCSITRIQVGMGR